MPSCRLPAQEQALMGQWGARRLLSPLLFIFLLSGAVLATSGSGELLFRSASLSLYDGSSVLAAEGLVEGQPASQPPQAVSASGQITLREGAYVNQRSLEPEGNLKCGVASVAMTAALVGRLPPERETLAGRANSLWLGYEAPTSVGAVEAMLDDQGLEAKIACLDADAAWGRLTRQIDAGYPALMLTTRLTVSGSGHYVVAVGYEQEAGRRLVRVYDSFGRWAGAGLGYELNSASPSSALGQGALYDFDEAWGYFSENCPEGYLLTIGEG